MLKILGLLSLCVIKVVEPLDSSDDCFELIFECELIFDGKVEVRAIMLNYANRYGLFENDLRQ